MILACLRQYRKQLTDQLLIGARIGDVVLIRQALTSGADPNSRDSAGMSALRLAVRSHRAEAVATILGAGADTRASHISVQDLGGVGLDVDVGGTVDCAIDVIRAAPELLDSLGTRALSNAVQSDDRIAVERLLSVGVDVNAVERRELMRNAPLMIAANQGNVPMVKLLLKHGANANQRDSVGLTAHDYAKAKRLFYDEGVRHKEDGAYIASRQWPAQYVASLSARRNELDQIIKLLTEHDADGAKNR